MACAYKDTINTTLQKMILHVRPLHGRVAVTSSRFHFVITLLTADCGIYFILIININIFIFFMNGLAQIASYHRTTLELTEPLRMTYSFINVCKSSLHE